MACSVAAVGEGTHAVVAPAFGWPIFCSTMSAISSVIAHMPLPICALPENPVGKARVDVGVLVGLDPRGALHRTLADHRARLHRGVDLVAGAVKEAGVDEHHPVCGGLDAGLQVERGAALLVHDADLDGGRRQAEHVLDAGEQLGGERHLVGPVHLRLDDVDRSGAAVGQRPVGVGLFRPCIAIEAGEQRVLDAFAVPRCPRRRRSRHWSSGVRRCGRTAGCGPAG